MAEGAWRFIRPDWTRPEGYEFVKKLTHAQMAWEFLRRRKRYRNDYVGFLDPTPLADRRRALRALDEAAPLRWFVPKNDGARYGKIEQTLGDFVRAVNREGGGDPRSFLRLRKANPQRYTIKEFLDPNLSPLSDTSVDFHPKLSHFRG